MHHTDEGFWAAYDALSPHIRSRADKQFAILKADPQHASLQFKKIRIRHGLEIWSVRVTLNYRALAIKMPYGFLWFWIGDHDTYETLIR